MTSTKFPEFCTPSPSPCHRHNYATYQKYRLFLGYHFPLLVQTSYVRHLDMYRKCLMSPSENSRRDMSPKSAFWLALVFAVATSVSALPGANVSSAEATAEEAKNSKRLQCLTCRNCRMFEVVIHSNDCDADSTHCMVRVVLCECDLVCKCGKFQRVLRWLFRRSTFIPGRSRGAAQRRKSAGKVRRYECKVYPKIA